MKILILMGLLSLMNENEMKNVKKFGITLQYLCFKISLKSYSKTFILFLHCCTKPYYRYRKQICSDLYRQKGPKLFNETIYNHRGFQSIT